MRFFFLTGAALASTLHVSPDEMATCWEAFSLNKSAGELTMHNFEAYKNEVYKHSEIRPPVTTSSEGAIQTRRVKREPTTNMVTPPAPKRHQRTAGPSPVSSIDNIAKANAGVSSSPARRALATPLPKYEERPKAGQVVLTYNPKEFPPMKHSAPVEKFRCVVSAKDFEESNTNSSYRHMFTTIEDRSEALEKRLTTMGKRLIERHGISDGSNGIAPLEQLNVPRQDTICCVGRICNEVSFYPIGNKLTQGFRRSPRISCRRMKESSMPLRLSWREAAPLVVVRGSTWIFLI